MWEKKKKLMSSLDCSIIVVLTDLNWTVNQFYLFDVWWKIAAHKTPCIFQLCLRGYFLRFNRFSLEFLFEFLESRKHTWNLITIPNLWIVQYYVMSFNFNESRLLFFYYLPKVMTFNQELLRATLVRISVSSVFLHTTEVQYFMHTCVIFLFGCAR